MLSEQKVGKVIRVEYDEDTGKVIMVMEITDSWFKSRVIHSKAYDDIISIKGKDVMVIASNSKKSKADNGK